MNEDWLKLSCYFGERQRRGAAFLADELLDAFGQAQIRVSIMLRGLEGFGLKHHLRTDRSLTLSEDLPIVAVAVDSRSRIEAVLGRVTELGPGLVTVERARLLTGDPVSRPEELPEATKLTIYVGRQERVYREPAFIAVCDLLHRRGIAGATVLLGVDGTAHGRRQRARFFSRNADVPMMVIAVGSGDLIARVLPELGGLLHRPLITLERASVCKRDGRRLAGPQPLPATDDDGMGLWQKVMIYTSEASLHRGEPIHRAITRRLRSRGAAGCTTVRGVWGFHGDHRPHGDRLLHLARHVPTVTTVIDTPERIAGVFPIIDELTQETGLVTTELVPALRAVSGARQRGGLRLANHWY
jgi:PII-like signaling protein